MKEALALTPALPMNLTSVGTSRCDVPARESAGGIVAPLNAARTAQRAVPTRFRGSMREVLFWRHLSQRERVRVRGNKALIFGRLQPFPATIDLHGSSSRAGGFAI